MLLTTATEKRGEFRIQNRTEEYIWTFRWSLVACSSSETMVESLGIILL